MFHYKIIFVFFTVCLVEKTSTHSKKDANLLAHMVLAQKLFEKKWWIVLITTLKRRLVKELNGGILPSLIFFSKCLVLLIEDIVICHPTEAELKKFPNLFFNPNFFFTI